MKRLQQCQREDPSFDSRNDESFRSAIRSLSIYDYKVGYLAGQGFDKEWGCPNEVNMVIDLELFQANRKLQRIRPRV